MKISENTAIGWFSIQEFNSIKILLKSLETKQCIDHKIRVNLLY